MMVAECGLLMMTNTSGPGPGARALAGTLYGMTKVMTGDFIHKSHIPNPHNTGSCVKTV
jgi:hypothetical protein